MFRISAISTLRAKRLMLNAIAFKSLVTIVLLCTLHFSLFTFALPVRADEYEDLQKQIGDLQSQLDGIVA